MNAADISFPHQTVELILFVQTRMSPSGTERHIVQKEFRRTLWICCCNIHTAGSDSSSRHGWGSRPQTARATRLPSGRGTCATEGKHKLAPCWGHPEHKVYLLSALNTSRYSNLSFFLPRAPVASLRREPPRAKAGGSCAVSVTWAGEVQTQHAATSTNRSSYYPVSWYFFDSKMLCPSSVFSLSRGSPFLFYCFFFFLDENLAFLKYLKSGCYKQGCYIKMLTLAQT